MALEKIVKYNVTLPDTSKGEEVEVGVTKVEIIMEDGQEIASTNHRHVIRPEDDWSSEPDNVKTQCELLFTDDVKAARNTFLAEQMKKKEEDELG